MADYKLVDSNKLDTDLTSVANAIRKRAGTSAKLEFPSGFENAVKNIPWGGEELPKLTNPASATDLALDKQLIGQNGNIVIGALAEVTDMLGLAKQPDSVVYSSGSKEVQITSGMYSPTDFIARSSMKFKSRVPGAEFGNAFADDVVAGITFTSENGVKVRGTHVCKSEGGVDTSDATATADQIIKNRTAYAKGEKLTGTIESLATTTITPGTTAQTITRKYIDGTLTIKGDSKLKPENIKEGVKIFDVLGTLAASSGGTVEIGEGIEVESLSEAHYWTKTGMVGGTINETYDDRGTTIGYMNESVQYADEVTLEGNNLVLVNPKSYTITMDDDAAAEVIVGKYFSNASGFYRIPSDAGIIYYAASQYVAAHLNATKVYKLSVTPGTEEQFSIVVSGDRNAYPDNGEKDGFTYVYQGVVSESDLPEVEQATPTISVDSNGLITASATQEAGQVAAGTKSATKQLTTQAAQTIIPGTSNKTIASGKYLTGTQTIKGDSNLKAENIKKGVSIFGVAGSHKCEEGVTLPELGETAAQPTDMAAGKVLYDDDGNPVTGTLEEWTPALMGLAKQPDSVSESSDHSEIQITSGMYDPMDFIGRSTLKFRARVPSTEFGNATANQVAKGATFTSADGLLVPGTLPDGGVLTLYGGTPDIYIEMKPGEPSVKGLTVNAKANTDRIIRAGDEVSVGATYDKFGNATANQVAKGATFTSAAGLLVEGTREEPTAETWVLTLQDGSTVEKVVHIE